MKLYIWLAAVFLVMAVPATGHAQTGNGKFTGAVRDSSGGAVAGATVTVKNERTGEERSQTTSNEGTVVIDRPIDAVEAVRIDLARSERHQSETEEKGRRAKHARPHRPKAEAPC